METVFAHLILDVGSVDKSIGFYRDQLGLPVHSMGDLDGHRLATVSANGFEILLLQQPLEDQPLFGPRGRGLVLNFKVSGLKQVAVKLKQGHVPVLRDIEDPAFGERTLLVSDPDGYAILLSEPVGTVH